jgi:hypothetical protein
MLAGRYNIGVSLQCGVWWWYQVLVMPIILESELLCRLAICDVSSLKRDFKKLNTSPRKISAPPKT